MSELLSVPLTRRLHRVPVIPLLHGRLAERAWSWDWHDQWTREWWPQGITWAGERLLVSWYAKSGGSRVSVIDLESRRYAHVTLLDSSGAPLKIHAGGLAWADGWLYVAATTKGFWTFHETDLRPSDGRAARSASDERRRDPATWQATALHRPVLADGGPPFRWSFLDAVPLGAEHHATYLYGGEYGRHSQTTRLWRQLVVDGRPVGGPEILGSGPQGMQGTTITASAHVVSTSRGPWHRGSVLALRRPPGASSERHRGLDVPDSPLVARDHQGPIGVEDLTMGSGGLWTVAEHPGRRGLLVCQEPRVHGESTQVSAPP